MDRHHLLEPRAGKRHLGARDRPVHADHSHHLRPVRDADARGLRGHDHQLRGHHETHSSPRTERGQILALFALSATVIILAIGLVIDGGNALNQRRVSQNTSDFAALAGARIIAQWIGGDATQRHRRQCQGRHHGHGGGQWRRSDHLRRPGRARYVAANGGVTGYVGTGAPGSAPPANTVGVKVSTSRSFKTYFLGIIGMGNLKASSEATARGGYAAGGPGGDVFPAGVALAFFQTYPFCTGEVGSSPDCDPRAPHPRLAQRAGRVRLAQVRGGRQVRRLRPRHEHDRRLPRGQAVPPGARSGRRRTRTAAALR